MSRNPTRPPRRDFLRFFCAGAECPGLDYQPSASQPHPLSCSDRPDRMSPEAVARAEMERRSHAAYFDLGLGLESDAGLES